MPAPRILIIEDEKGLVQSLNWYFEKEGYETHAAADGHEGLKMARALNPDVVLLDVMLPSLDGLTVCRELRASEKTRDIPIIMITAKSQEADQIEGFARGADDYVTKPFNNKILLQRIKALLRRVDGPADPADVVEHLGLKIDRLRHRVTLGNTAVELTPTEFRLLECLVRQPGRAFTRQQLMDAAIGEGQIVLERTIDVHIKTLRKKLSQSTGGPELIETVRGFGYRFLEGKAA